ncbi:MAG TPA: biopolymer transporter ExbD, partial [Ignavibacteriaceae bacterium]|nr:biopolymer transporter ExbD [Ignavibacteriaceae bacterium]
MKFETTNKPLAAFSYSSLTDIVMLLLIFFLLTSQFVIQTGVKVKLPGAKNNE